MGSRRPFRFYLYGIRQWAHGGHFVFIYMGLDSGLTAAILFLFILEGVKYQGILLTEVQNPNLWEVLQPFLMGVRMPVMAEQV